MLKNLNILFFFTSITLYATEWNNELQGKLELFNAQKTGDQLTSIAAHYAQKNDHPLCYFFAKQACDFAFTNKEFEYITQDLLSTSAWHMKDYEIGYKALQKALTLKPEDPHLLGNLAIYVQKNRNTHTPRPILQLQPNLGGISGVEQHIIAFNKVFFNNHIDSVLLVNKNAYFIVDKINSPGHGRPCIIYEHNDYLARLSDIIITDPSVIVCNSLEQVRLIVPIRKYLSVPIVYVNHNSLWRYNDADLALLSEIQAITTVHYKEQEILNQYKAEKRLKTPIIEHIPPFVDDERFTTFKPTRNRCNYFLQRFNLSINDNEPVLSTIANFFWFKNYGLLIEALNIVKNKKNKHFRAILAGHGPELQTHKTTAEQYGLSENIHFVGLTLDTPELLHFADIHVLPSYDESFGIAHIEAALMQKPFVGAKTTGIEPYVLEGINGLLFENRNAESLAEAIIFLLDNPEKRIAMGKAAQQTALLELSSTASFKKWQKMLTSIIK